MLSEMHFGKIMCQLWYGRRKGKKDLNEQGKCRVRRLAGLRRDHWVLQYLIVPIGSRRKSCFQELLREQD